MQLPQLCYLHTLFVFASFLSPSILFPRSLSGCNLTAEERLVFDSQDKYTQRDGGIKGKNKTLQHPMNHFKRSLFSSKLEQTSMNPSITLFVLRVWSDVCHSLVLPALMEQTNIDMIEEKKIDMMYRCVLWWLNKTIRIILSPPCRCHIISVHNFDQILCYLQ